MKRVTSKSLILVLLILCTSFISVFSQMNDLERSMFLKVKYDVDSISRVLSRYEQQVLSLQSENLEINNQLTEIKVSKGYFASSLSIQTGIFSIIVALAIFISSFLIPRKREDKYKKLLTETKQQVELNQTETNGAISFLDMIRLRDDKSYTTALNAGLTSLKFNAGLMESVHAKRIDITIAYLLEIIDELKDADVKKIMEDKKTKYETIIQNLDAHPLIDQFREAYKTFTEKIDSIIK